MKIDEKESIDPPRMPNDESGEGGSAGYGEPPQNSRFKHGRSGNPKGRPPGRKSRKKIVEEIANEMHWIDEGGRRRRRSTLELVLLFLRNRSLDGNARAFRTYYALLEKYEPQHSRPGTGFLLAPEPVTMEEFIEINNIEVVRKEAT